MKLIGPSHCMRLKHYLDQKIIPDLFPKAKISAYAGIPIWHGLIDSELNDINSKNFVIVGDFRFGNKIYDESVEISYSSKSILGISKSNISKHNDYDLFVKSNNVLQQLNPDTNKLVFWDLYFREKQNIVNGKYIDVKNKYKHPIWNYNELSDRYTNSINLESYCDEAWNDFIIDKSNHPSLFGVLLLSSLYNDTRYSHVDAKKNVSSNLAALILQSKSAIVVSRSLSNKLFLLLDKYMGDSATKVKVFTYKNSVTEITDNLDIYNIVLITEETFEYQQKSYSDLKDGVIFLKRKCKGTVKVFLYNYSSNFIDSKRKKQKKHKYDLLNVGTPYDLTSIEVLFPEIIPCASEHPDFLDSLFELRVSDPTFKFLVFILYFLAWPYNDIGRFIDFYDYFMRSTLVNLGMDDYC